MLICKITNISLFRCFFFRFCNGNFGVGPLLESQISGDVANKFTFLRNERIVLYQPRMEYEGPDYFTYSIFDGQNIQVHSGGPDSSKSGVASDNEVTIHVRNCRLSQRFSSNQMLHPLCPCASTENNVIGNMADCSFGYRQICANNSSRSHFLNLCLVCEAGMNSLSVMQGSESSFTSACISEIVRAVGFVTQRHFCTLSPPTDCSAELITVKGRESVNYLSLKPYTLHGSYTELGNGIGGYGWYDSAILN